MSFLRIRLKSAAGRLVPFKRNRKNIILLVSVILLMVCILAVVIFRPSKNEIQDTTDRTPNIPYVEPSGGDPSVVVKHYKTSISMQKKGKIDESKQFAEKAIQEYSKLTIAQQEKIPNVGRVSTDLIDLRQGNYYVPKR